MKQKKRYTLCVVTCALILTGCKPENAEPINLVVAVDVSSPSEERLTGYGSSLYRLQRMLDDSSELTVRTFAHAGEVVFEGRRIAGRGEFNERIGSELLKAHGRERIRGTHTELALERAADSVEASSNLCVVVLYTDGGIEDQSSVVIESIDKSVARLADCTQLVAIVVCGVLPQHRELWEDWLTPLGDKAYVRGTNDANELLAEVIETAKSGGLQ